MFVYGFALPSAIHLMYEQHTDDANVGCRAEYEHIGDFLSIFLTEFVPITFGFCLNVFSFYRVKRKMASRAFPRSVRNRRRRVMLYYLAVCVLCWAPTMLHYAYSLAFGSSRFLEVLARCLLYLTGLFNFLVFGINVSGGGRKGGRGRERDGMLHCQQIPFCVTHHHRHGRALFSICILYCAPNVLSSDVL